MKKIFILILLITISKQKLFAQNKLSEVNFCNDNKGKLSRCQTGNYILNFNGQLLKSISTKDSSIFYDVEKQYFKFNTQFSNTITVQLQKDGTIAVYDKKNDTLFKREMVSENRNCQTQPNFVDMINSDTTFISFSYQYCRLQNIFLGDLHMGSINMAIYKCTGQNNYSWDVSIVPYSKDLSNLGNSLKILTDKKSGKPNLISICDEIKLGLAEKDAGVEIVSNPVKSVNLFYKVRNVVATQHSGVFAYEDIIVYYKKGKLKSSKVDVKQCDYK